MSKGRLTRQELGWLLTQEAQGAAERLRKGVTALTQPPPPPEAPAGDEADASAVDASLSALDDTMKMLSSLHARPIGTRGRRGRIDLASLLWEVAPEARVSIEPGSGTEVFGDEAELRRMFHVMLGHASGSGSAVAIRREADEVIVSIALGPDSSTTTDTERAWLSRMAVRYGGRYELEGGTEILALPAEGIESRDDLARLRKELEEAKKQGEAYARELAAVWTAGDETPVSTLPPSEGGADRERFAALVRLAGGVAATLRGMLSPVGRRLVELRGSHGVRKAQSDPDVGARAALDEGLEQIAQKLLSVQDFVAELAAVGESDPYETSGVDLSAVVHLEVSALESRAARAGIKLRLFEAPRTRPGGLIVPAGPRAAALLVRELVWQAISASPPGAVVSIGVHPPDGDMGARLVIDDAGTTLPEAARRALLSLEVEPGTFGRPSGVALFVAAEISRAQGARLDLGDAPVESGGGGGVRVSVIFPH